MVEETFIAPTPREAFELAKEKYGQFSELKLLKAIQLKDEQGKLVSQITVSVSSDRFLESIGVDEEQELIREIDTLKSQIEGMKDAMSGTKRSGEESQQVRRLLLQKGLSEAWVEEILQPVENTAIAEDAQLLLSYVLDEIDARIAVKPEELKRHKMMMLIGSTGVGKTTTVAKLAARFAVMMERPLKVALVNLDSFRVGAYEQLEHYASQMQITHIRVERVEAFGEVLDTLGGYDVVLIDTAGISPYDTGRLIKTIEFLKSTQSHTIETSLVIAATAKREDILDIYEHFSFLDIDNAILTKFDETKSVGELFSFLTEKRIPVSYISGGQHVPEDLEVATKERLMERFAGELNG